jgi:hypothetical protein
MTGLLQDLADALRHIRARPRGAAIAICSLALGIGTIAANVIPVYSGVVSLSPLANSNQLHKLCAARSSTDTPYSRMEFSLQSYAHYQEIRRNAAQADKAIRPCSGAQRPESSTLRQELQTVSAEKVRRCTRQVCNRGGGGANAASG